MLRRFSHFFACLLLVLIPLQAVAAANMSICNSTMQSNAQQAMQNMPCHDNMNSKHSKKSSEKSTCKAHCATLCASLSAMTALPSITPATAFLVPAQIVSFPQQVYVSITQPNLQRPPILLS